VLSNLHPKSGRVGPARDEGEILIVGLLVAGGPERARHLSVPYTIVLVVGAMLGFVPGLPEDKLDPELVVVVRSIRGCC
jgi:hypothetical protein